MPLEVAGLCAGVVALSANILFLSTMNKHVGFQFRIFDAFVPTLVATVSLLSIMLKNVRFEVFGSLEREIALKT